MTPVNNNRILEEYEIIKKGIKDLERVVMDIRVLLVGSEYEKGEGGLMGDIKHNATELERHRLYMDTTIRSMQARLDKLERWKDRVVVAIAVASALSGFGLGKLFE